MIRGEKNQIQIGPIGKSDFFFFLLTLVTNPIKAACSGKKALYVNKRIEIKMVSFRFIFAKFKIGKLCLFSWLIFNYVLHIRIF